MSSGNPVDSSTVREEEWRAPARTLSPAGLTIVSSPDTAAVQRFVPLSPGNIATLGRAAPDAGLRIEDEKLSRIHLRITWDGRSDGYRLGDGGSANGTFVNGARTQSALLADQDVIRVGRTLIVFSADRATEEASDWQQIAKSELPVLLCGETGVGKDVTARRIHERSGRPGSFVAVNCSALPRDLAAAELFGHTRAAFSGAVQARAGVFVSANHGTLFLDEVAELPLELQAMLLRVLEDGKVRALGSDREEHVSVRVIAATNADLARAMERRGFRPDLYARLCHHRIELRPLRQRRRELLSLAVQFASGSELAWDASEALLLGDYPFNVRELKSVVQRARELATTASIELADLDRVAPALVRRLLERRAEGASGAPPPMPARPGRAELERLLTQHAGSVSAVASALSTSRTQVYRWLKAYGWERKP